MNSQNSLTGCSCWSPTKGLEDEGCTVEFDGEQIESITWDGNTTVTLSAIS